MHDCFGKPIKPFDRVRAATKEELEARTPPDRSGVEAFTGEKFILSGNTSGQTCNVQIVDELSWPAFMHSPDGGGIASFAFKGGAGYATAHKLVKLEG